MELKTNVLYYGDNLEILGKHIPDESIDLIYLDPPFSSKRTFNVIFKEPSGEESAAQIRAFTDFWRWDEAAAVAYREIIETGPHRVSRLVASLYEGVGPNALMAYLVMMALRLLDLRRVLKSTGALYLHCDATASHYLKVILDSIFGPQNYRSEVVWRRTNVHNDPKRYGAVHDTILFYTKSSRWTWNQEHQSYTEAHIQTSYRKVDAEGRPYMEADLTASKPGGDVEYEWKGVRPYKGRYWAYSREHMEEFEREGRLIYRKTGMPRLKRYLDEGPGVPVQTLWMDIAPAKGSERLGYQTQKPLALLERIISVSSNEGDIVLDPFCGCGTAVVAAHKLNRRWIGIDITHLAITVMKERLRDSFSGIEFEVVGEPADVASAQALAEQDRYQFEWWALSLVNAKPVGDDRKKGADRGIDGIIGFVETGGKAKRVVVQVKSGHVNPGQIRDLKGTMQREKAEIGLFLTLEPPTQGMATEAASAGFYHSDLWNEDYPRIQICTIEELLEGKLPKLPRWAGGGFPKAQKIARKEGEQAEML